MKNYNNKKKTYQHLSIEERENIAIGLELKKSLDMFGIKKEPHIFLAFDLGQILSSG